MSIVKAVFRFVLLGICVAFSYACIAQGTYAGTIVRTALAPDGNSTWKSSAASQIPGRARRHQLGYFGYGDGQ